MPAVPSPSGWTTRVWLSDNRVRGLSLAAVAPDHVHAVKKRMLVEVVPPCLAAYVLDLARYAVCDCLNS